MSEAENMKGRSIFVSDLIDGKENVKPEEKRGIASQSKAASFKLTDESSYLASPKVTSLSLQVDLMEVEQASFSLAQTMEEFSERIMGVHQALYDQPKIESRAALMSLKDELIELSFAESIWEEYAKAQHIVRWPKQQSWKEAVLSDYFLLKHFDTKYPRNLAEVIEYGNYFEGKDFYKRPDIIWSLVISAGFRNPASLYYLGHFLEPLVIPCEHGAYKDKLPKKMWKQSMAEFSAVLDDTNADHLLRNEAHYMWALEGGYLCHLVRNDLEEEVIKRLKQADRTLKEELLWLHIRNYYAPLYLESIDTVPSTKEEYEALLQRYPNNNQILSRLAEFELKAESVENLKQKESLLLSRIEQGWTEGYLYLGDAYFTVARKRPRPLNAAELEQKGSEYLQRVGEAGIAQGYIDLGFWLRKSPSLPWSENIKDEKDKEIILNAYEQYKEAGEYDHPGGWKWAHSMARKLCGYACDINDEAQMKKFSEMREQMWNNYRLSVYLSHNSIFSDIKEYLKDILQ